jgi:hypothetical protein
MPKRKNLVHEKIKKAKPEDLIQLQLKLPAHLLQDIKTYGDTSKVIRRALKLSLKTKYKDALMEIIGDIRKEIDKLETIRETEGILDENHLQLLELYKDIYFRLKKARILKKGKQHN